MRSWALVVVIAAGCSPLAQELDAGTPSSSLLYRVLDVVPSSELPTGTLVTEP